MKINKILLFFSIFNFSIFLNIKITCSSIEIENKTESEISGRIYRSSFYGQGPDLIFKLNPKEKRELNLENVCPISCTSKETPPCYGECFFFGINATDEKTALNGNFNLFNIISKKISLKITKGLNNLQIENQ